MKSRVSRLREIDPHEVGHPHFRFHNPLVQGQLEFIVQALYDYYEVALNTALTKQILFAVPEGGPYEPAGGATFNKNRIHTNLSMPSSLQSPEKHATMVISVLIRSDAAVADAVAFLFATQVTFTVGGSKKYFEGLAATAPSGYGAWANTGVSGNGWPAISNQQSLSMTGSDPVDIEQQQAFSVVFDPTQLQGGAPVMSAAPGTGLKAWIRLEGQLARAVQ